MTSKLAAVLFVTSLSTTTLAQQAPPSPPQIQPPAAPSAPNRPQATIKPQSQRQSVCGNTVLMAPPGVDDRIAKTPATETFKMRVLRPQGCWDAMQNKPSPPPAPRLALTLIYGPAPSR